MKYNTVVADSMYVRNYFISIRDDRQQNKYITSVQTPVLKVKEIWILAIRSLQTNQTVFIKTVKPWIIVYYHLWSKAAYKY